MEPKVAKNSALAKVAKTAISVADGAYVNLVSQLGTGRDKASHGQFIKDLTIPDYELEGAYQDWLAKRVINRPVSDMLRAGWYFTGLTDDQAAQLSEACQRVELIPRLARLLVVMRLYGVAYIVFGVIDGGLPTDELDISRLRTGGLQFFSVLKKSQVRADTSEYLPAEQAAGLLDQPKFYKVDKPNGGFNRIHHSRIICIKNGDEGESVLQAIYHTLRNYAATNAGAASLVQESKVDIIRTPKLATRLQENMKAVVERIGAAALLKSINGMLVLDKEEEYESKSYSFTGLPDLMREFAVQTAGAADIPYTILFGQSPAGMSATGEHDTRNYYDRIATDQAWTLRPLLNKLFALICQSTFGSVPKGFGFEFNPLWQLEPKVRAEVEKANSERDKNYIELGVLTEAQVARQLRDDGTYTVIDDTHINTLEAMTSQQQDEL